MSKLTLYTCEECGHWDVEHKIWENLNNVRPRQEGYEYYCYSCDMHPKNVDEQSLTPDEIVAYKVSWKLNPKDYGNK